MLFVNISTDRIQCLVDGTETIIEHVDLEKSIARFLKAQFTMKNPQSHKVFVLN